MPLRNHLFIMKICVYCASSDQIDQKFFKATEKLATEFVTDNISAVCGGGANGLMGQLADTMLALGGNIKGIMPKFMDDIEWSHKGIKDFQFTETMQERKEQLIEGVDGVVALAGGCGTMEELFEVITLKRLGLFTKPIVILNTEGFYDDLKSLMEKMVSEKFLSQQHLDMWTFVDQPEDIIPAIKKAKTWSKDAIDFATLK